MNEASSIGQAGVAAHKCVTRYCRPVDLHPQGVYDHILCGLVEFWVDEGHEIVASYHIPRALSLSSTLLILTLSGNVFLSA